VCGVAEEDSTRFEKLVVELSDYLNRLATLAAGSIVVLGTFAGSAQGDDGAGAGWAVASVVFFAATIVAAMLARIAFIALAYGHEDGIEDDKGLLENLSVYALVVGLFAFAGGIVTLGVYAAQKVS
jgi:hypothetical protein